VTIETRTETLASKRTALWLRAKAQGTVFLPDDERDEPFMHNPEAAPNPEYKPICDERYEYRQALREGPNVTALRNLAVEILSEPAYLDANVKYARYVLRVILDDLNARDRITTKDDDDISAAFDLGVRHASAAVARAWLNERRSVPIP
jgi:hypothetical protein